MREGLKARFIKTPEEFEAVQRLAQATVNKRLRTDVPTISFFNNGSVKGFAQVYTVPLIMSGWDPATISPRELVEGVNHIRSWSNLQYGETLMSNHDDSPVWPYMEKLGFRNTGLTVFRSA